MWFSFCDLCNNVHKSVRISKQILMYMNFGIAKSPISFMNIWKNITENPWNHFDIL